MLVWPGFELETSRSADRRYPNWANQAAVIIVFIGISAELYLLFSSFFFTESCLSGHGLKNLFPFSLQKLNLKIVWLLNAMTSQAMERTESVGWLRMVPLLNGLNQILFVCNSVISNNVFTKCTKTMKNSVEIMCIDSCLNSSTIQKGWREKRKEVAIMYSSWFKEFYSPLRQNHLSLWDANSKVHHQQVFWAKYLRNNANTCYN